MLQSASSEVGAQLDLADIGEDATDIDEELEVVAVVNYYLAPKLPADPSQGTPALNQSCLIK